MFRLLLVAVGLAAATGLLSRPADALSLTNRDGREHVVRISDGETEREIRLKPNQRLRGLCQSGCVLSLESGVESEFFGEEAVVIDDGAFLVEELAAGSLRGRH